MRIAIDFIIICSLLFSICYLDKRLCSLPKQGCTSEVHRNRDVTLHRLAGTETTKKQIPDTTYTLIPHPVLADYTDAIQKDKL